MDTGKKTRLGICTFHYAVNPGSVLQAYALYKQISAIAPWLDVSILNYHSPKYPPFHIALRRALKKHKFRKQRLFNLLAYLRYQRFYKCIGGLGRRWDFVMETAAKDGFEAIAKDYFKNNKRQILKKKIELILPKGLISRVKHIKNRIYG